MPVKPIDPKAVSAVFQQAEKERLEAAVAPAKPFDFSSSSIAPKQMVHSLENFKPSRPHLKPSLSDALLDNLAIIDETYGVGNSIQKGELRELQKIQTHQQEVQRQKAEKLKETAEKNKDRDVWSVLQTIGSFILAAVGAIVGLVACEVAPVIGGLAIAASIFTIANGAFLSPQGFWEWVGKQIAGENEELKKFIAVFVPMILGLLAAGASVFALGQLHGQGLDLPRQLFQAIESAVGIFTGVATVGKGVTDYQVLQSEADHNRKQAEIERDQRTVQQLTTYIQDSAKTVSQAISSGKETVRLYCELLRKSSIPA